MEGTISPLELVQRELAANGVVLRKMPGEFGVTDQVTKAETFFETLDEAAAHGRQIAAQRPWTPPVIGRRKGRRFWLMPPRARLRARIKAHNRKLAKRDRNGA